VRNTSLYRPQAHALVEILVEMLRMVLEEAVEGVDISVMFGYMGKGGRKCIDYL